MSINGSQGVQEGQVNEYNFCIACFLCSLLSLFGFCYDSDWEGDPQTCSWRAWKSDARVQIYALQVYGRSPNRYNKCKFAGWK